MRSYLPLIPLLAGLAACGMKGDLYLPETTGPAAAPAAMSPAEGAPAEGAPAEDAPAGEPSPETVEAASPAHPEDPERKTIPSTPDPALSD